MTSPTKVDLIKQAIKQVMEEVKDGSKSTSSSSSSFDGDNDGGDDNNHHHRQLLSKLMSQLEKLENEPDELANNEVSRSEEADGEEKIVKELKELKRQNLITHCLLSVLIVITVVWQISEVSLILKLKDGVTHPVRSIGRILKSMIKPRKPNGNGNYEDNDSSITGNLKSSITSNFKSSIACNLIESTPVHDLKIPDFPRLDLPKFDFGFNYEDRLV